MADFALAYAYLSADEGGYANNPSDPGGETYRGISRANWPAWSGWAIVDAAKSDPAFPHVLDGEETLQNLVKSFYSVHFWRFAGLNSQAVANKLLDMAVQDGLETAVKCLQNALRFVLNSPHVSLDGQYGPETERAANEADVQSLLQELRAQMALYYCGRNNPAFIRGWMRRAVR